MSVYGNGLLAYHLEVRVASGHLEMVKSHVAGWKRELRREGTWPGFPEAMLTRLQGVPGVTDVVREGPQSAVLIPLRMARGMTAEDCTMSTVVGTGPVTRSIETALDQWGIELEATRRLPDADSPMEISFRDPDGQHASLRLYPTSRTKYRGTLRPWHPGPNHLILNRFNRGLQRLAELVHVSGGIVSFRPRELGRHDRIDDYTALFPLTKHLILSSRHGILRNFAGHAGIAVGRGWPNILDTPDHPTLQQLADQLLARLPPSAVVVFHRYPAGDSAFFAHRSVPVIVPAPEGYDAASRAARIQGALLGASLAPDNCVPGSGDAERWRRCCEKIIDTAFRGTDSRPWCYPPFDRTGDDS